MVVTTDKITETQALAIGTSAQKYELIALTRALVLSKGKNVNVDTDSKYAFMVVFAHGEIWKERRLIISENKDMKHAKEIFQLLEAVDLPNQIDIMHFPGYQQNGSQTSRETKLPIKYQEKLPRAATSWGFVSPPGLVRI